MDNCSPFKWRHFEAEIILLCVRWYLRYSLSYRDVEEVMLERGTGQQVKDQTLVMSLSDLRARISSTLSGGAK